MKIKEILSKENKLDEDTIELFEMSNLRPAETGLNDFIIWVRPEPISLQHAPRIKVYRGNKVIPSEGSTISIIPPMIRGKDNIGLTQNEFSKISEWIIQNRDSLLNFLANRLTKDELVARLIKYHDNTSPPSSDISQSDK